ncbi:MAG: biopolymer transporter ExbD [Acidobacteriota bacterium]|nr:biopolymer transporter ExbD [Acidobacteriota bacterium]
MKIVRGKPRIMADINITPFTDVVLVLLIVFMVATPALYESSLKVELPHGTTAEDARKDVVVTIDADGGIYLDDRRVDLENLGKAVMEMTASGLEPQVIVNGDRNVKYDAVIAVMDVLAQSGVKNPGLGIEIKR